MRHDEESHNVDIHGIILNTWWGWCTGTLCDTLCKKGNFVALLLLTFRHQSFTFKF
jgi:hypothetical protein